MLNTMLYPGRSPETPASFPPLPVPPRPKLPGCADSVECCTLASPRATRKTPLALPAADNPEAAESEAETESHSPAWLARATTQTATTAQAQAVGITPARAATTMSGVSRGAQF